MLEKFRALVSEYDMLPAGETVLCAVSGGADSMCLLHLLVRESARTGFSVAAAHFNHGLRAGEADGDEAFVAAYCSAAGIPLSIGRGDVQAAARRSGRGIEDAARALRYAFLAETAAAVQAARTATAHTADDNLETLLLRLTRGAGLRGLAGIPPRRERIVRPLLRVSRAEILSYLQANGVPFREDSSNRDPRFARNRIRSEVIPVLRALNPNLAETAARSIASLREDDAYLTAQAARAVSGAQAAFGGTTVYASALSALPPAVCARAVRALFRGLEGAEEQSLNAGHYEAIRQLARSKNPSDRLDLPGGVQANRVGELLLLTVGAPLRPTFAPAAPSKEEETILFAAGWRVHFRPAGKNEVFLQTRDTFWLKYDMIKHTLLMRPRQSGDAIRLCGRKRRTLKRAMIDAGIPRLLRDAVPVLADEDGVIAVAGFGADASRLAEPGDRAVRVTMRQMEPSSRGPYGT